MGCIIGYMLTWTTYGSWLQGSSKGYSKDGRVFGADSKLFRANVKLLKKPAVVLNDKRKLLVHDEITRTAEKIGQHIYALSVYSNHVHVVVNNIEKKIDSVAGLYKNNTTYVVRKSGIVGKVWTKGFDKRFCYDEDGLRAMIKYVEGH